LKTKKFTELSFQPCSEKLVTFFDTRNKFASDSEQRRRVAGSCNFATEEIMGA